VTAVVLLGDIVERPTQLYLVTEVLNMWEVSMGGSHNINFQSFKAIFETPLVHPNVFNLLGIEQVM
jgi:hypothetical protein